MGLVAEYLDGFGHAKWAQASMGRVVGVELSCSA